MSVKEEKDLEFVGGVGEKEGRGARNGGNEVSKEGTPSAEGEKAVEKA